MSIELNTYIYTHKEEQEQLCLEDLEEAGEAEVEIDKVTILEAEVIIITTTTDPFKGNTNLLP